MILEAKGSQLLKTALQLGEVGDSFGTILMMYKLLYKLCFYGNTTLQSYLDIHYGFLILKNLLSP